MTEAVTLAVLPNHLTEAFEHSARQDHIGQTRARIGGGEQAGEFAGRASNRNCARQARRWEAFSCLVHEAAKLLGELSIALLGSVSGYLKSDGAEALSVARGVAL